MIRGAGVALALMLAACGDDGDHAPCATAIEVPRAILAGERCDVLGDTRWGASCVSGGAAGFEAQIASLGDTVLRVWTAPSPAVPHVHGELSRPGVCVGQVDLSALDEFAPPDRVWVDGDTFVVSDVDGQGMPVSVRVDRDGNVTDAGAIYPGLPTLRVGDHKARIDVGVVSIDDAAVDLGVDRYAEQLHGDARGVLVLWRLAFGSTLGVSLVGWDGRVVTSLELGENDYLVSAAIAPDGAYLITVPSTTPGCGGRAVEVVVLEADLRVRARRPLGATAYLVQLAATTDGVWVALDAASEDTTENDLRATSYACRMPAFLRLGPSGEVLEAFTPASR